MLELVLRVVSLTLARIGGGLLLATAVLVAVEVVLRKSQIVVLNLGTELSSYALAIGGSWAFAYVVFERGHVRVDVITQRLPALPRAIFDVVAMASLALVGLVLSLGTSTTLLTSLRLAAKANTTLATPLVIPQGLWVFGLGWFTLIAAYRTVTAAAALLRRDLSEVSRIAAPASTTTEAEELADETRHRLKG